MGKSLILAFLAAALPGQDVKTIFAGSGDPRPKGEIDRLVFARLKQLRIRPAAPASDAVFLRRVYLDVTGTLPEPAEAARFLASSDPEKRAALIDELLERGEYAEYQAMKWADVLRVKAEFPINLWPNAAQAYHRWILASIRGNKPYDRFARELLTATGSNFREPPVNFYRAVQGRNPGAFAQAAALTFLGARASRWPAERLEGMSAFFARIGFKETREWKEEIVFFDSSKPVPAGAMLPDGTRVRLAPEEDPREVFAAWLVSPRNPDFSRAAANRVWSWLFGRGIVHEPDDMRPDNPPVNPALLDYLGREFTASGYDLKKLYRLILNSATYQLAPVPADKAPEGAANFAYYQPRRLEAEVLIDALCQITGTTESYSSAIPEPFTYVPEGQRSATLPDGSISSSFLELFGRPPRDTGFESERNNRLTAAQRLHLLNSSHVQRKIEQSPKLQVLLRNTRDPRAAVNALYLAILSRYPAADELKAIAGYAQSGTAPGRQAMTDLAWALINSAEFLHRH